MRNKVVTHDDTDDDTDADLVEAVGDGGQDEDPAEGGEDPDPPGDPGLAGLAGDHGGGHNMGLEYSGFEETSKYFYHSYLECEMSFIHQEGQFGHASDKF